jgi:hypothetical protein
LIFGGKVRAKHAPEMVQLFGTKDVLIGERGVPMDEGERPRRRGSITGALFLIGIGVLFLLGTLRPEFNPWWALMRYWPVILILLGLGKIWDAYRIRHNPGLERDSGALGTVLAVLLFLAFIGIALWMGRGGAATNHDAQTVELQGAKTVDADVEMPAGTLDLRGGSNRLLDADFSFRESEGKPHVDYTVTGGQGQLAVTQNEKHLHFAGRRSDWKLRFANDVPLDLKVSLGAGKSDLKLRDMDVTHLEIHIGVGQMDLDLTGQRKSDLQVELEGGVGQARILLPRDVGVQAHVSGGIGSVGSDGLKRDGDTYVNDAYSKPGPKILLNVQGGVGQIDLVQER